MVEVVEVVGGLVRGRGGAGDERRRRLLFAGEMIDRGELGRAGDEGGARERATLGRVEQTGGLAVSDDRRVRGADRPVERLGRVGPAVGGGCVAGLFGAAAELVGALAGGGGELLQRGSLLALGQRGGRGAVGARERRLGAGLGRRQVVGRGVVALVGALAAGGQGDAGGAGAAEDEQAATRDLEHAATLLMQMSAKPASREALTAHGERVSACRRCPRLVAWREACAADPPRRYRGEDYWARPLPGFGDPAARLVVVGLAPAAHGGNRTGRMFTGDRSGEWLYGALHRAGYANQPSFERRGDGLRLTRRLRHRRRPLRAAGQQAHAGRARQLPAVAGAPSWSCSARRGCCSRSARSPGTAPCARCARSAHEVPRPKPRFGHGAEAQRRPVSRCSAATTRRQQNTFTGKLTAPMLDDVFARARELGGQVALTAPILGGDVPAQRPQRAHPAADPRGAGARRRAARRDPERRRARGDRVRARRAHRRPRRLHRPLAASR